jgi:phospholipid transport system substrate-binding protein
VKDTDNAEVDTKIVTDKVEKVSINYKLHLANEEWKISDIVIDNISLVNNYRSRFIASSYNPLSRISFTT